MTRVSLTETFGRLPPEWPENPLSMIQSIIKDRGEKVVVLDDDPTGTQTVSAVPVLTVWSEDMLNSELANDLPVFYLLINSRSVSLEEAKSLNRQIGSNLVAATGRLRRKF